MTKAWYVYDGYGDPYLPSNYHLMTVKPSCRNGNVICAIYATANCPPDLNPIDISYNLQTYISNGLANGLAQPEVPAGAKKFLYLRISL